MAFLERILAGKKCDHRRADLKEILSILPLNGSSYVSMIFTCIFGVNKNYDFLI